jgi:lipopolysaccharide biosynthesis regulator YciM
MLAQIKRREISDPSHHEKHQACMKTGQANDQAFAVKLANDEALFQGIIKLLEQLALQSARYVCKHCGFQANRHYWQCPGCHQWDRYPPQRTDEISRS